MFTTRFTMRSTTVDAIPLALQPLLGGLAPDTARRYLKTAASIG